MGQCMNKRKYPSDSIFARVQLIVEHNDILDLEFISRTEEFSEFFTKINEGHFKISTIKLDLLGLAAYHSSCDCFKFIHKVLKSNFALSDSLLVEQGSSLIEIICTRGNTEILQYYLPYYTPEHNDLVVEEFSESLNFTNNCEEIIKKKPISSHTAVQKACEQGNINILGFIFKYYEGKVSIPMQLDIEYQDESSGENCALIACRKINYAMIKFLHQVCKSNFRLLNKQGENAVQIMAATHKRCEVKDFYECFVYLVNQVGVDIMYNYEETLLIIQCDKTAKFFEKKLMEKGISIKKNEIEKHYEIVKPDYVKSVVEEKIESLATKNIGFCTLYGEVMDKDEELSFIEPKQDTPFTSILENDSQ